MAQITTGACKSIIANKPKRGDSNPLPHRIDSNLLKPMEEIIKDLSAFAVQNIAKHRMQLTILHDVDWKSVYFAFPKVPNAPNGVLEVTISFINGEVYAEWEGFPEPTTKSDIFIRLNSYLAGISETLLPIK